jgi:HAD superfamily hydrolase (TIGR01549 family)
MRDIKVLSFDMDGTLVCPTFADEVWHRYLPSLRARKLRISLKEAERLCQLEYDEIGDGRKEWYDLDYWIKRFGLEVEKERIFLDCAKEVRLYPEVRQVLERLRKEYQLVVYTNAPRDFTKFQLEVSGIAPFFSRVYSSLTDFGEVKKKESFSSILSQLEIGPNQMVHVGDHPKFDFEVPRSLGITAYLVDRKGKLRGEYVIRNLRELEQKLP